MLSFNLVIFASLWYIRTTKNEEVLEWWKAENVAKSRSLQVLQEPLRFRKAQTVLAGLGNVCTAKSRAGWSQNDTNVLLHYLPWGWSSHRVVGTTHTGLSLLPRRSPGRSWEDAGCPISLALALCLHHEVFGVNDVQPGQAILTVAIHTPPTFHVEVILTYTKRVSLSFLSFCSVAFLKPKPASRLDSLNRQEPDKGFCLWIGGRVILWLGS